MEESREIIACIPLWAQSTAPKEQKNCTIEECPSCKKDMWVSEAKRELMKSKKYEIACCYCVAEICMIEGGKVIVEDLPKK